MNNLYFKLLRTEMAKLLSCCRILSFLFIAMLAISYNSTAQQNIQGVIPVMAPTGGFGIDGDAYSNTPTTNVGDWFEGSGGTGGGVMNLLTGLPIDPTVTFFLKDKWGGDGQDQTIFLSSAKINDNPTSYSIGPGQNPNKNEIQNVGVHFAYGNPALGGNATDLWCIFAGDRQVTNGSSYLDFEFLQNSLVLNSNGSFTTLGPDGGRTAGDILVTVEFTNGGPVANVVINEWSQISPGVFQYVVHPNSEFSGAIYATVNTSPTNVPFDVYGTSPGSYVVNQWCEGAVNLSALFKLYENPCKSLSTVFVRTRTSGTSDQSELKDIPGAPIQLKLLAQPPVAHCPSPVSLSACTSATDIQTAYTNWKSGFSYSGGLAPVTDNIGNIPDLPANAACAGVNLSFQYSVTDYCGKTSTCTSTFTVGAPPALVINKPATNYSASACAFANQAAVNAAFATWLQGFSKSGGCSPQGSFEGTPTAPVLCTGGTTNVTYNVTDLCSSGSVTATFTITAPPALVINKPDNIINCSSAYANQEALDAAFADWLQGFTKTGGCSPQGSFEGNPTAPTMSTGGTIVVIYNVTDLCESGTVTASFTINPNPVLVITNPEIACDGTTVDITAAAITAGSTLPDGTVLSYWEDEAVTIEIELAVAQAIYLGNTYYIKAVTLAGCMDIKPVLVEFKNCTPPSEFCTYTQGKYGNQNNSTACDLEQQIATNLFVANLLNQGPLQIGGPENYVLFNAGDASVINNILPGGSGVSVLNGPCIVNGGTTTLTAKKYLNKQGRLNNGLLAQTLTLGLNLRINGDLAGLPLESGKYLTTQKKLSCEIGSGVVEPVCTPVYALDGITITGYNMTVNPYWYGTLTSTVVDFLNSTPGYAATVEGLYKLANDALGGMTLPINLTLTNIMSAVDLINNAFDECRVFVGYRDTKFACYLENNAPVIRNAEIDPGHNASSLKVYPNPFSDQVVFEFSTSKDTKAELVISTILGQKVATLLNAPVKAGEVFRIQYTPQNVAPGILIYQLITDDGVQSGRLIYKK